MIGRTVSHYRIVGQLGAGGMGVVYAAEDDRLGRPVALKFVPEEMAKDQQAIERLRAEARTASGLNHPNICTIYDIGEYDGRPFIVMELLKGQTLRERLTSGPLKVHDAVELGIHVADALDAAHHRGVMHRDIKPANLFLVERGQVKILDFGLAKLVRQQMSGTTTGPTRDQTAEGVTLGTVSYMSPEQVTGEALDGRTDLFSLGVVLYECLTGHQPFTGKTSAVIFSAILTRAPLAPIVFNPDIPLRLQDVINNCLEKDRELRYQDAAGLRADLKRVKRDLESGHSGVFTLGGAAGTGGARSHSAHSESLTRHDSASRHDSAARHDSASRESLERTGERRGGASATTTIVLTLVVVLAAAGSFIVWSRSRTTTTTVNPPPAQPSSQSPARAGLGLANSSLEAKDYRNALAYADEVLRNTPDDADAIRIRDAARAMIDRFERAVGRARERLSAGDPDGAGSAINEARAIEPSSPIVAELSGELVKQLRTQAESARRDADRLRAAPAPPTHQPPTDTARTDARRQHPPRESPTTPAAPAPAPVTPSPPTTTTSSEPQPSPSSTAGSAPQSAAAQPPVTTTSPAAAPPPPTSAPAVPRPAPSEPAATAAPTPPPAEAAPEPREAARAAPTAETDDAAIRRVVASYGRAIESKDIALFRRVKPNLSPDEQRRIEDSFRSVASQQVAITILSIELHGDDASVRLRRRDTIQAGGRQQTTETQQTLTLTRSASGWVIRDIGR